MLPQCIGDGRFLRQAAVPSAASGNSCLMIEQPTQRSVLERAGLLHGMHHVNGNDAYVETREGHDAFHLAPDSRRTP